MIWGAKKWVFGRPNKKTDTTFCRQLYSKMMNETLVSPAGRVNKQINNKQGKIEQLGQWMLEDWDKQSPLLVQGTSCNYLFIIYFEI